MTVPLRVLILEDCEADAELVLFELRQAGYDPEWSRVDNREDYLDRLSSSFDIILADFSLPQFDALQALRLLKERGLDVPFIVVTGAVGEEVVAECMRLGATDYLLKDRMGRLGSAVERALQEKLLNVEKQRAVAALRDNEEKYRSLFESSPESITLVGLDGKILDCNNATTNIAGQPKHKLIGKSFLDIGILEEQDVPSIMERFAQIISGSTFDPFQVQIHRSSGEVLWLEIHLALLKKDEETHAIQVIARDITENRIAAEALQDSEKRFRRLAEAAFEGIVISDQGLFLDVNNQIASFLGYEPSEMIGMYVLDFVAKEWRDLVREQIQTESEDLYECFLQRRDGSTFPVEVRAKSLPYKGKNVRVTALRDVTESKKAEQEIQALNSELLVAYDETLAGWARALDLRDKSTEDHSLRVMDLTMELAHALGIAEYDLIHIRRGALLHDIGKMGIPDSILLKPGPLNEEEWRIMRMHPEFAFDLLSKIPFLKPALDIPYCHHEKWDGSGYPRGLAGNRIPLAARIFSVVDVWDALGSDRPYRGKWAKRKIIDYIREESGTRFDPEIVDLFLKKI